MNLRSIGSVVVIAACLAGGLPGESPQEIRFDSIEKLDLHHLNADMVTYDGRADSA